MMSNEPLPQPYLLFLGDVTQSGYAKTAYGLRDWAPERCIGEFALAGCTVSTGLPRLSPMEAQARGARSLVIGVAPAGGRIQPTWIEALVEGLDAGLDIVSGLHARLGDEPRLAEAAARTGRRFYEVRRPPAGLPVGTGAKRTGKRLLTVGTDCALGKKYTALGLSRAFVTRGVDATFRATGQTGILIAGEGVPLDSVVCDFTAGAAEQLTPDAGSGHWDVIEGQGSLAHPAFAGVSLGLLHGSQPDVIVVCHEPGRTAMIGAASGYAPSTLEHAIELNLRLGALTNPAIRCAGVSLNTSRLDEAQAQDVLARTEARLGLPAADPVRGGTAFERLVDSCLA